MLHWLTGVLASATTAITFFTLFLVGVVFSAFSLVMGGHGGDHGVDHDIGHDIGHDADVSHDTDASHDSGGDHDGAGGGTFSVGMFSVRGVALLCTGFGGIGFLVYTATGKVYFSTAAALVGGYVFAFIVLYTLKVFKAQQANSLVNMNSAVGTPGVVTVSIPEDGLGEVSLVISGVEMFRSARSQDGKPIRSGSQVRVSRVAGGTFIVAEGAEGATPMTSAASQSERK